MPATDHYNRVPDHRGTDLPVKTPQPADAGRALASQPPGNEPAETSSPNAVVLDTVLAGNLKSMGGGLYLWGTLGATFPQLSPNACVEYVTEMVRDSGDQGSALQQLLVEQLLALHHAAGRLLVKAAHAGTAEASALLHAAAARMFAEYRKSLIVLKTSREPSAAPTQVTVLGNIAQQNVTSGTQHIAMIQREDGQDGLENPEARLEGDQPGEVTNGSAGRTPRSAARRDRPKKPGQVEGLHARRPRALAAGGKGV